MKIYLAKYNPCTHESAYGILSVHETKEGAQKAIDKHKLSRINMLKIIWNNTDDEIEAIQMEDWIVSEMDLIK